MAYKQKSPIPIAEGGTNATGLLNTEGVLVYDGTRIVSIDPGSATQVLTSNGPILRPTFQAAAASGIVTLDGDSGSATGTTVTIAGAGTITTSATGSTVTITGTGGGLTFNNQASSTVTMAVNNSYLINNGASLVTATLPATAALGTQFQIIGSSSGGWTIAQASGQSIHFGSSTTTTGVGGSLSSTNQYDQITLMCSVANTTFVVTSSLGNITVV